MQRRLTVLEGCRIHRHARQLQQRCGVPQVQRPAGQLAHLILSQQPVLCAARLHSILSSSAICIVAGRCPAAVRRPPQGMHARFWVCIIMRAWRGPALHDGTPGAPAKNAALDVKDLAALHYHHHHALAKINERLLLWHQTSSIQVLDQAPLWKRLTMHGASQVPMIHLPLPEGCTPTCHCQVKVFCDCHALAPSVEACGLPFAPPRLPHLWYRRRHQIHIRLRTCPHKLYNCRWLAYLLSAVD